MFCSLRVQNYYNYFNYTFIGHALYDIAPYWLCCRGSFSACGKYYDRRPNDDCSDYPERPPPGVHLYTPA